MQDDELAKELEQFDKEMAALEAESEEQLREEFEKLQEDRNIDELDQQLEQWKRIVNLEKRAEELQNKDSSEKPAKKMRVDSDKNLDTNGSIALAESEGEEYSDLEEFDDKFLDWRSKGIR